MGRGPRKNKKKKLDDKINKNPLILLPITFLIKFHQNPQNTISLRMDQKILSKVLSGLSDKKFINMN